MYLPLAFLSFQSLYSLLFTAAPGHPEIPPHAAWPLPQLISSYVGGSCFAGRAFLLIVFS
jgi:hypothetical protein